MDELKNIVELMFGDWSDYYYFSQQINMIFKVLWLCKVSETERFSFNTWEGEIIWQEDWNKGICSLASVAR